MMRSERSLPILAVYYFLVSLAAVQGGFALLSGYQASRARVLDFEVVTRAVGLDVEDGELVATYKLLLRREGTVETPLVVEAPVTKDEFTERRFLDKYQPGTRLKALMWRNRPQDLDLQVSQRWGGLIGLAIGGGMFALFAWFAKPAAFGADMSENIGWKFGALTGFFVLSIAIPLYLTQGNALPEAGARVGVEGVGRKLEAAAALAELVGEKVTFSAAVGGWIGDTISFCEYGFGGKTYRTTSLGCQPGEGERKAGRVNPVDPRDVLWE